MLHNYDKHFDSIMVSLNYFREDFQQVKIVITAINNESEIFFDLFKSLSESFTCWIRKEKGELIYRDS